MPIPDVILLFFVSGFFFYGFFFGLIRTIGAIISLVGGVLVAGAAYPFFISQLGSIKFIANAPGKAVLYIVIFSLAYRLINMAFMAIDRSFDLISIIPFLKSTNKICGALFGIMLGTILVGLALKGSMAFPFTERLVRAWFGKSSLSPFFMEAGGIALSVLPGIFNWAKGKVDGVIQSLDAGFRS